MQGSTEASTSRIPIEGAATSRPSPQPASSSSSRKHQTWDQVARSGLAGGLAGCIAKTSVGVLFRSEIIKACSAMCCHAKSGTALPKEHAMLKLFLDMQLPLIESRFSSRLARNLSRNTQVPANMAQSTCNDRADQRLYVKGSWTGVFSAMREIYREAGVRGLLQGHSATLLRIFPYAGIKFMAYEAFHTLLMPTSEDVTSVRLFTAGALSGVTSVFLTYPLDLIRVRLAYDRRLPTSQLGGHSVLIFSILKIYHEGDPKPRQGFTLPPLPDSAQSITRQPYFKNPSKAVILSSTLFQNVPVLKFYRGFIVSVIGMVPYAGTSFLVWGWLKKRYAPRAQDGTTKKTGAIANLGFGAIAGAAAQTASYPFEVVRRRMQVGGLLRPDRFFGFWETVQFVYARKGWRGFFVGLSIGYLKVVPLTAISFASWEGLKRLMHVK